VLVLGVVGTAVLLYHVAVDADDRVTIRRGIREISVLLPSPLRLRVETDFHTDDLTSDSAVRARVMDSRLGGVWSQAGERGRRWIDSILPLLRPETQGRAILELSGRLPSGYAKGSIYSPLRIQVVADSLLLRPDDPGERVAWVSGILSLQTAPFDCAGAEPGRTDLSMLDLPSQGLVAELRALATFALGSPATNLFLDFSYWLTVAAYRAFEAERLGSGGNWTVIDQEVSAVGRLLRAMSVGRRRQGHEAALSVNETAVLERYRTSWCRAAMGLVLAHLGSLADQAANQASLLDAVATIDYVRQGHSVTVTQRLALRALEALAANGELSSASVSTVFRHVAKTGPRGVGVTLALVEWIWQIAPHVALPDDVRAYLFGRFAVLPEPDDVLPHRVSLDSMSPPAAFRALAANVRFLTASERTDLLARLPTLHRRYPDSPELADGIGYLGAAGVADREAIGYVERMARAGEGRARGFDPVSSRAHAAVAIGRIAQQRRLEPALTEWLLQYAVREPEIPNVREIVRGLAHQRSPGREGAQTAADIRESIAGAGCCAHRRRVVVEIAVEHVLQLPSIQRDATLAGLRDRWAVEREPDVRMGIGQVTLKTVGAIAERGPQS